MVKTFRLQTIFVAGEYCDYETKLWVESIFNVPVINHWWQSETGHPITALCLGYGMDCSLPKFSTGLPVPGYRSEFLFIRVSKKRFASTLSRVILRENIFSSVRREIIQVYCTLRSRLQLEHFPKEP